MSGSWQASKTLVNALTYASAAVMDETRRMQVCYYDVENRLFSKSELAIGDWTDASMNMGPAIQLDMGCLTNRHGSILVFNDNLGGL